MTLAEGQSLIAAAIRKASEIGRPRNIAADGGSHLAAFSRMDGAWLGSINIAINEA